MRAEKLRAVICDSTGHKYVTYLWEFTNGVILAPHEDAHAEFFSCREVYEPVGLAEVVSIDEVGFAEEWEPQELAHVIVKSIKEYGVDAVPSEVFELF